MAAVFAALALLWAAALTPLNKAWTKFGILLYRAVSPVIMAILFYVTVTPIALLMRLLGKDPLRLRHDPKCRELLDRQDTSRASAGIHEEPILTPMLSFLQEFWSFLRVRKKYWLVPILIMMVAFGGLIVLTQGSAIAPFIYTVF